MRSRPRSAAETHLVTEARTSRSADIAYRQRRYLIMMGIRVVCFVITIVLFVNHAGWLTAIPAVGAIAIPYFAVVLANGGREPDARRGFREYHAPLPDRFSPSGPASSFPPARPGSIPPAGSDSVPPAGSDGFPPAGSDGFPPPGPDGPTAGQGNAGTGVPQPPGS